MSEIIFSHQCAKPSFEFDLKSFEAWLSETFESFVSLQQIAGFVMANFSSVITDEQKGTIDAHLSGLTEGAEATKLELISRQDGPTVFAHLQSKKVALAAKTWDQMSATERKLAMNLQLTADEIDSL